MARTTGGAPEGHVKFACSLCGVPRFYPSEMKYTAERFFQCNWHSDTTTNLEEARKHGQHRIGSDVPPFPVGVKADWQS